MADRDKIASGSAEGLMEFIDWLVEKGYATRAAVGPWKSASRQVFRIVEGEPYGGLDVSSLDPDEYMDRFEKLAAGQYKLESLASYRSRFRKAIEAYRGYLSEKKIPSFRVSPTRKSRPKAKQSHKPARGSSLGRHPDTASTPERATSTAGLGLIEYPFPLNSGEVARLRLPAKLDAGDADRIAAFVQTLVFKPRKPA
ncbi:MAG: hypothetical protein ACRDKH_03630 [Solirubrobacterales bacterium]